MLALTPHFILPTHTRRQPAPREWTSTSWTSQDAGCILNEPFRSQTQERGQEPGAHWSQVHQPLGPGDDQVPQPTSSTQVWCMHPRHGPGFLPPLYRQGRLAVKHQSAHHQEEPKVRVTLSLHGHHATGWQTQRPVPQNMWKELKIFPPSSCTQLGSQSFCFPCGAIKSS